MYTRGLCILVCLVLASGSFPAQSWQAVGGQFVVPCAPGTGQGSGVTADCNLAFSPITSDSRAYVCFSVYVAGADDRDRFFRFDGTSTSSACSPIQTISWQQLGPGTPGASLSGGIPYGVGYYHPISFGYVTIGGTPTLTPFVYRKDKGRYNFPGGCSNDGSLTYYDPTANGWVDAASCTSSCGTCCATTCGTFSSCVVTGVSGWGTSSKGAHDSSLDINVVAATTATLYSIPVVAFIDRDLSPTPCTCNECDLVRVKCLPAFHADWITVGDTTASTSGTPYSNFQQTPEPYGAARFTTVKIAPDGESLYVAYMISHVSGENCTTNSCPPLSPAVGSRLMVRQWTPTSSTPPSSGVWAGTWATIGDSYFCDTSYTNPYNVAFELDRLGDPWVAYKSGDNIVVMKVNSSGNWARVGDVFAGTCAPSNSFGFRVRLGLKFDSCNNPYVLYSLPSAQSTTNPISIRRLDGQTWTTFSSTTALSPGQADFFALAIDRADNVFVAFSDDTSNGAGRTSVITYSQSLDRPSIIGQGCYSCTPSPCTTPPIPSLTTDPTTALNPNPTAASGPVSYGFKITNAIPSAPYALYIGAQLNPPDTTTLSPCSVYLGSPAELATGTINATTGEAQIGLTVPIEAAGLIFAVQAVVADSARFTLTNALFGCVH